MKVTKKFLTFILMMIIIFLNITISYGDNEANQGSSTPDVLSDSAFLMDSYTNKILYDKNGDERRYPASTTKIMTAILALENCKLDDVVTVPYEAIMKVPSGYAIAALQDGEQLTMEQILQLLLVHSANDAANVIAYHVSGSIEEFANLMNQKVQDLGLTNTHFTNPSGIHDENHYTTAHDMAILMQYCMKNSDFRRLAGLSSCTIPATNKYEQRIFKNTDEMLIPNDSTSQRNYYYKYAIAGKTGYTQEAKNCLVTVVNKDGFEVISVVLSVNSYPNGLSGRFIDTKKLLDYAYDNYAIKKIADKDSIITNLDIKNASKDTRSLDLLLTEDISVLVEQKDINNTYNPTIELKDNLFAPIVKGQVVGKVTYDVDGIGYSSDLVASHSVEVSTFGKKLVQILLILLILFILYKLLSGKNNKRNRSYNYYKKKNLRTSGNKDIYRNKSSRSKRNRTKRKK